MPPPPMIRRRFLRPGMGRMGAAPGSPATPFTASAESASMFQDQFNLRLGQQDWRAQTGIEENNGGDYPDLPDIQADVSLPLDPGINLPGYVNPYRTIMYSITNISTSVPLRAIPGNSKRTYLIVQNLGPGNLFLGIGVDPVVGGANVLNLISTQLYEQIGGGCFIPPNPWYPQGLSLCASFVSPEYLSLMVDTPGTNAMVLEGSYMPLRAGASAPGS